MNAIGGLFLLSSVATTPLGNVARAALHCPSAAASVVANTAKPLEAELPIDTDICSFLTPQALAEITKKFNEAGWKALAVSKIADIYSTTRLAMTQGQASHFFSAMCNGVLVPIMFNKMLPEQAIIAAMQFLSGTFNTGYAGIQEIPTPKDIAEGKVGRQRTSKSTKLRGRGPVFMQKVQENVLLAYNEHMALVGVGKEVGQKIASLTGGKVPLGLKPIYRELTSFYPGDLHRIGAMLMYAGGMLGLIPIMFMVGPEAEVMKLSATLVLAGGATLNGSLWFESIRNRDKLLIAMIPLQTFSAAYANVWPVLNALANIFGSALMVHFAKLASQKKNQD
jgi:hypothetical protein